ncbi:MAG: hypothetical protein Kow00114_07490 [Kiloniellaceae bacterium]
MTVEEPLALIAPLADATAREYCRRDGASGESCAWYHGSVDYLRLLGVMSSPAEDSGFLQPTFQRLARNPGCRDVLVSGAGDCAMLAQLLAGFGTAGAEPSVTLIDRCATPVRLNRWFAERNGLALETEAVNLLDYATDRRFDLICTHCFIGYFTPAQRPALFAKWFALLRPGGRVVTVNPVRHTADHSLLRFSAEQAAAFEARALAALRDRPDILNGDAEELRCRVRAFTANFASYPVRSINELRGHFEAAGFVVEHCAPLPSPDSGGAPGERGPAYHAVIALRP